MEIKIINEENDSLILENFNVVANTGSDQIIEADLNILLGEISVRTRISLMLSKIDEFLSETRKIYRKGKGELTLSDLDKRISIVFECEKSGDVYIKGGVNNKLYSAKVEFDFNINQSYLPSLIEQTKEVVLLLN